VSGSLSVESKCVNLSLLQLQATSRRLESYCRCLDAQATRNSLRQASLRTPVNVRTGRRDQRRIRMETDQEVKEEVEKTAKRKRVPTRRFIKHVLRTRVAAAQALESFLAELESGEYRVNARPWLVEAAPYGGEASQAEQQSTEDEGKDAVDRFPMGTRSGEEVVEFLRWQGARILPSASEHNGWDALSGDETEARSGNED
jgi:hypothetical protein